MTTFAIVGSRDYPEIEQVYTVLGEMVTPHDTIVSGGARGVDFAAESWAGRNKVPCVVIEPDWKTYGRSAGMKRNTQIVEAADIVVAFWDGDSHGTKDSIDKALRMGKTLLVIQPKSVLL